MSGHHRRTKQQRRSAAPVRRTVTVGPADAVSEVRADRVADRVVAELHGSHAQIAAAEPSTIARSFAGEAAPIGAAGGELSAEMHSAIVSARGAGVPLAAPVRRQMEHALGSDFSAVRVHTGPDARALNAAVSARAFTLDRDIFFAHGLPDTSTPAGTHLLAHELAHVQQGGEDAHRCFGEDMQMRDPIDEYDDESESSDGESQWRSGSEMGDDDGYGQYSEEASGGMDVQIQDLTERMSQLSLVEEFQTAIDPGKTHAVAVHNDEIWVASNPKTLKQIILDGSWLGHAIAPAKLGALKQLHYQAKAALYRISGKTYKPGTVSKRTNAVKTTIKGSRTPARMEALRKVLESVGTALSEPTNFSVPTDVMPETNLSTSDRFTDTSSKVEGLHVKATPLSLKSATPGSSPKDGRLMKAVRKLAGDDHRKSYVQMHLLNDLVFGPGKAWNLTPGPKQSNATMERLVETPLKRAILGKGLVMMFEAKVTYDHDPYTATDTEIDQNPAKYIFKKIDFSARQLRYDGVTGLWNFALVQDPDVQAVDGAVVKWDYGNLPRLKPKPKIFDPTTTAADLEDIGVDRASAARIVGFVARNPGFRLKGAGKKESLAAAVLRDTPNLGALSTAWDATKVLWS